MTACRRGFSVKVFLPTGSPDGLQFVEKANWTWKELVDRVHE
jgi:hypothetical protein